MEEKIEEFKQFHNIQGDIDLPFKIENNRLKVFYRMKWNFLTKIKSGIPYAKGTLRQKHGINLLRALKIIDASESKENEKDLLPVFYDKNIFWCSSAVFIESEIGLFMEKPGGWILLREFALDSLRYSCEALEEIYGKEGLLEFQQRLASFVCEKENRPLIPKILELEKWVKDKPKFSIRELAVRTGCTAEKK